MPQTSVINAFLRFTEHSLKPSTAYHFLPQTSPAPQCLIDRCTSLDENADSIASVFAVAFSPWPHDSALSRFEQIFCIRVASSASTAHENTLVNPCPASESRLE